MHDPEWFEPPEGNHLTHQSFRSEADADHAFTESTLANFVSVHFSFQ
jgi:hypothetical protein